jgi:PAS domain S-box-containing protein
VTQVTFPVFTADFCCFTICLPMGVLPDSAVPAWIVDVETWRVVEANEPALRLWGYSREEFIGLHASEFVIEQELPRMGKEKQANRWGESAAWTCKRKDGRRFSLSLRWHQAEYNGRLSNFAFATEYRES